MQLRVAVIEDISELCGLLNYLFEQEVEFKPDEKIQTKGLKRILSQPDVGEIIVAQESTKIIGMVNLLYTVSTALGSRVAILEDMIVMPEARSKGVGSKLINFAFERAEHRGCKRITLLTDYDNDGAHRFYLRHGFDRSSMVAFRKSI